MAKDKEVERGKAVQQQLRVWDVLLEIRIRLQKMLVEANKLPLEKGIWSTYESSIGNTSTKTVKSTIDRVKENIVKLKSATEVETPFEIPPHTLNQIQQITGDKERLIRRTQLKRTKYDIIGKSKGQDEGMEVGEEYDPEIFDDDDFYHQILRELIERKTSNVTDPVQLSRHWLELQKLRGKTKRKVDTKASKARKIRYEVYPKLVNLMAPADEAQMTEHAVNELFQSLFGGRKV